MSEPAEALGGNQRVGPIRKAVDVAEALEKALVLGDRAPGLAGALEGPRIRGCGECPEAVGGRETPQPRVFVGRLFKRGIEFECPRTSQHPLESRLSLRGLQGDPVFRVVKPWRHDARKPELSLPGDKDAPDDSVAAAKRSQSMARLVQCHGVIGIRGGDEGVKPPVGERGCGQAVQRTFQLRCDSLLLQALVRDAEAFYGLHLPARGHCPQRQQDEGWSGHRRQVDDEPLARSGRRQASHGRSS